MSEMMDDAMEDAMAMDGDEVDEVVDQVRTRACECLALHSVNAPFRRPRSIVLTSRAGTHTTTTTTISSLPLRRSCGR